MSGNGQRKLKLSGNGNECKALILGILSEPAYQMVLLDTPGVGPAG